MRIQGFFTTFPSPARKTPSPARKTPLPLDKAPDNTFPNKEAPSVPKSIDKNPPFCYLVSFSIVFPTPVNKTPESSSA